MVLDIRKIDLSDLASELESLYDGNLHLAVKRLDLILYMLFYVDQEVVCFNHIQDTAYELTILKNCLQKIADDNSPKVVKLVPL